MTVSQNACEIQSDALKNVHGRVYLQTECGQPLQLLDCTGISNIDESLGDVTTGFCWNHTTGRFERIGATQDTPGNVTLTLNMRLRKQVLALQKLKCEFNLFVLVKQCDKPSRDQTLFDWGFRLVGGRITSRAYQNVAAFDTQAFQQLDVNISGQTLELLENIGVFTSQLGTFNGSVTGIDYAGSESCEDDNCGGLTEQCEAGYLTTSAGNVHSKQLNWAATPTSPFGGGASLNGVKVFEIGSGLTRVITSRAAQLTSPWQLSFSDNGGTTWTTVTLPSANNVSASTTSYNNFLYYDHSNGNLWAVASDGTTYLSTNNGLSWTQVHNGSLSANPVNSIASCGNKVYKVGNNGFIAASLDGGTSWGALNSPVPTTVNILDVATNGRRLYVTTANGRVFYTDNQGTTWFQYNFANAGTGEVRHITLSSKCCIAFDQYDGTNTFYHRSIDSINFKSYGPVCIDAVDMVACGCDSYFGISSVGVLASLNTSSAT